jgi:hypothetical protein
MVELKVIGLVDLEEEIAGKNPKSISLKKEFDWLLGEEFQKLLEGFEPIDNREFMDKGKNGKPICRI